MDYAKQFGGSVVKSAGDLLIGVGKAGELQADADAAAPTDKFDLQHEGGPERRHGGRQG